MVIIGCGPVGKVLALQLAEAGLRIAVVDKRTDAYPLPRAVTHDAEIARILQSISLPPDTIADVTEPYDGIYRWENAEREVLLEVDWSGVGESGWHNTYFFHQPALEERLERRLRALPNVAVLRGWAYAGHTEEADGVSVRLCHDADGADLELGAQFLVGADGAGSAVRAAMGVEWQDNKYFSDWLVVDVLPGPDAVPMVEARQRCDPERPHTMVPGGPGRRRWEFMRLPRERVADIDRADFAWRLLSEYGVNQQNSVLERHTTYRFQAGWASTWRQGRVFLAGDAAHLMPPFAGQGMCTGLRDAMNLGWKLRAVLSGAATEALLDSYAAERIPHTAETVDFSVRLGKLICVTDRASAGDRDGRMLRARARCATAERPPRPRLGSGLHHGAHGGTLSIQAMVGDGRRGPAMLDDVLGGAGGLLVRDGRLLGGLGRSELWELAAIGIRPCILDSTGQTPAAQGALRLVDVDQRYRRWFEELAADAVLVRPDFYLYDTARTDAGVRLMVRRFLAEMKGTPVPL